MPLKLGLVCCFFFCFNMTVTSQTLKQKGGWYTSTLSSLPPQKFHHVEIHLPHTRVWTILDHSDWQHRQLPSNLLLSSTQRNQKRGHIPFCCFQSYFMVADAHIDSKNYGLIPGSQRSLAILLLFSPLNQVLFVFFNIQLPSRLVFQSDCICKLSTR